MGGQECAALGRQAGGPIPAKGALQPVVRGLAKHFELAYVFIASTGGSITWKSDWALLARDPARLAIDEIKDAASFEPSSAPVAVWTDDYSNLLGRLRW